MPEYLVLVQQVVDRAARAARYGVLFNCDDGVVGLGKFEDKVFVQGLDEAHVGDGGVEFVTDLLRRGDHAAPGEDGGFVAFSDGFALADGECAEVFGYACAWPFAPGVAYGGWAWMVKTGGQHFSTLVFVLGGHDDEVGDAAQVAVVEAAGVGGAVGADESGAVEGEQDIQVLDGDVVDELVVAALEEGGVDGDDGLHALAGLAGGEGDGVLFGYCHVKVPFGVLFGEFDKA